MKKDKVLKIVTFLVLTIFMLSLGVMSFAKQIEPDHVNWDHLHSCGYIFEESEDDYGVFICGGSTTTSIDKYSVVLVELLQLQFVNEEAVWEPYYSFGDEDIGIALAEEEVEVDTDYTYRLRITHQVKDASGDLLEEYVHYSATKAF